VFPARSGARVAIPRGDPAALARAVRRYAAAPLGDRLHVRGRALLADLLAVEPQLPAAGTIVDLGCGRGLFSNLLVEASSRRSVVGMDPDRRRIAVARLTERARLRFEVGDAREAQLPACDAVAIVDVLYLLTEADQELVLARASGAVRPGVVSLTLGTSGVIFATTDQPLVEPEGRLHAFCHAVPGKWHFMGVTLAAAGSLQWYRDTLAPSEGFDAIVAEAERAPAGSEGLLFLPYLSGERTPYPDPLARGSFVGLTLRHRRAHMTRAVLEGVAFSMKDCFGLLQGAGLGAVREVRIAGGGAKGPLWRRIVASVLGLPMVTATSTEGAAYGAALLAGVGAAAWPSVEAACDATIAVTGRDEPVREWMEGYAALYPRYRELYPALKPTFDALGN